MFPYAKLIAIGVTLLAMAASGWFTRGWFEDSKRLAVEQDRKALVDEIREGQAKIAEEVEARLSELKANERIIDRGVIREIQKPIYQRVCLEPTAIRLLNDAARGTRSAEPDGEVPPDPASAD